MTDIYQDEALQAKIFDLWDQGRTIGEIIAELHLDLDEFLEFFLFKYLSHYEPRNTNHLPQLRA